MLTFPVGLMNKGNLQDPFLANVALHLKGDGENNSTAIVDSSPTPKTLTLFGNTKISTLQAKYGGSSIYFDGTGDYLGISSSPDFAFGTEPFTIECWIYVGSSSGSQFARIVHSDSFQATGGWFLVANWGTPTASIPAFHNGNNTFSLNSNFTLPTNQWSHIAFTRSSGTSRIFVNGVLRNSGTAMGTENFTNQNCFIGGKDSNFLGYIDSLRITKGIARYTSNFNPETDTYLAY